MARYEAPLPPPGVGRPAAPRHLPLLPHNSSVTGDWRDWRPAIWLTMLGIAVMLLISPFYWGALFIGAGAGAAIRIQQRRRRAAALAAAKPSPPGPGRSQGSRKRKRAR